jgi:uncharacterized protein (UPF0335 family)
MSGSDEKKDAPKKPLPFTADSIVNDVLKSYVERIELVHAERKDLADDVASIYAEAKANGYEVKALRYVIKRRTKDPAEYKRLEDIAHAYMLALGMET